VSAIVRYRSPDEDSVRWSAFPFRAGDIVISTRSKSGTTWVQMICALLVFQSPSLPAPLVELSPWVDWLGEPRDELVARLEAQQHRRFVKTHTPLDGIPIDPRATYIVVGRHPLDMAVSLYHQGGNIDRKRVAALTGQDDTPRPLPPLHEWLIGWIDRDADPRHDMDSLPGVVWHIADAWQRREAPNIVLVHYNDLSSDLDATMRYLASRLGIAVDEERWPELVEAATFAHMRRRADELTPDARGVLLDRSKFFREGRSGSGNDELTETEQVAYSRRVQSLASADVLTWLHGGSLNGVT
jgi:hypothetical protein